MKTIEETKSSFSHGSMLCKKRKKADSSRKRKPTTTLNVAKG